jgi:hypothetical protein
MKTQQCAQCVFGRKGNGPNQYTVDGNMPVSWDWKNHGMFGLMIHTVWK